MAKRTFGTFLLGIVTSATTFVPVATLKRPLASRVLRPAGANMTSDFSVPLSKVSLALMTNDFIAEGKDGYTALGTVFKAGRSVNTYLLYTQSFVDYVLLKDSLARPVCRDYSHQKVITQAAVSLP